MKKSAMILKALSGLVLALSVASCSCGGTDSGTPQDSGSGNYTISYSTEYGTAPASKNVEDGYKLVAGDLPTLSADGFVFGGWDKAVGFEVKADTTITAVWAPIGSYAITYNLKGGTNAASNPSSFRESEAVTLADPTRAGCTFKGWYTEEDYSGTAVTGWAAGEKTANVELYAKWEVTVPEGFAYIEDVSIVGSADFKTFGFDGVFIAGRTVKLSPFMMCDHEVTQKEYLKYCTYGGTAPDAVYGVGDNYPAYNVSWYDALVYCNKRSIDEGLDPVYKINGSTDPDTWGAVPSSDDATWNGASCDLSKNGYRLPTEAEWECAARGGKPSEAAWKWEYAGADSTETGSPYTDTALDSVGWYDGNSSSKTHEVKQKAKNSLSLHDMSGNVFEWCWDWYGDIGTGSDENPAGPSSGAYRVYRGGSWSGNADISCVAFRDYISPDYWNGNLGFRVCRSVR